MESGGRSREFGLVTAYQACNGCNSNLQLGVDFPLSFATLIGAGQQLVMHVAPDFGYGRFE